MENHIAHLTMIRDHLKLVGGFNPFEKYDRQIGSCPQLGMKIKNIWNHHPDYDSRSSQIIVNIPIHLGWFATQKIQSKVPF